MDSNDNKNKPEAENSNWMRSVAKYNNPDLRRSLWQLFNSVVPYFIMWYLMYRSIGVSYWLTLALAIPTAGFMVRLFIIFHDCGHGSFFKSQRANSIVGIITGILTFTPYYHWRYEHAVHHATSGDLDRRGVGDVWTLTVQEYQKSSPWKRFMYRIYRNPVIMFGIGPLYMFLISHRFASRDVKNRERHSVYWTNLALLAIAVLMSLTIGLKAFLLIQLPILIIAGSAGVWLFYVQHQFEGVYWERHEKWDFVTSALQGSSFYKLPKVIQWFSGNIGFHHIHHLSSRIPNYFLEKCHNENVVPQKVKPVTLRSSLKSLRFRLWDEEQGKLIGFHELDAFRKAYATKIIRLPVFTVGFPGNKNKQL